MRRLLVALFVVGALVPLGCSDDPAEPTGSSNGGGGGSLFNDPPQITEQTDTSAAVGATLRLTAQATDPNNDAVTYRLTIIIRGANDRNIEASIDSDTGAFEFQPKTSDMPSRRFIFTAVDRHGAEASTEFDVQVTN